jgi:hypothetical protein
MTATVSERCRSVVEVTGRPLVSRRKPMGQTGCLRSSSPDGSDDGSGCSAASAIYDEIVVPRPVVPSSEDSPELGSQPSACAPHVPCFEDEPPGMVSSSGDDSEDEQINRVRRAA